MADQKMTDRAGADLLGKLARASEASREVSARMTDAQLEELWARGIDFITHAEFVRRSRAYELAQVEASPAAAN